MAVNANAHIIGVAGGKGGVGKSVFAANLALAFLAEMRQPVLLMDMDARTCGDQCFILGLRDAKTLGELCAYQGSITPQTIGSLATMHPGSGLAFVAGTRTRDETLNVQPDVAIKQLESLSNLFRYIVVDLGNDMGALQMSVIERATIVLAVTLPEVLAVNQTARLAGELIAATLPAEMVQIVVNKATSSGLQPAAIAQTLRRAVIGAVPQDDATAGAALQRSAPFTISAPKTPIAAAHYDIVRKLTGGTLQQLRATARPKELKFQKDGPVVSGADASAAANIRGKGAPKTVDARTALKLSIHAELIKAMDLKKNLTDTQGDPEKEKELRRKTQGVITALVDREGQGLGREDRSLVIKEVLDEALGLGPLEDLLEDIAVTEIMVNGPDKIYVEKNGVISLSSMKFTSAFHLRKVIERIVAPLGRQINESSPYVDARLHDGSRVNAVIEPLALDGAAVTIRKFRKKPVSPDTYSKEWNACSVQMMEFLRICVANGLNIIISGGTGSGKTTLLNTLSGFIPSTDRIVTIEDAAELQLKQDHVVRLETRPKNMEGAGEVTIRDLVRNSLRMRPDRIVVGECRDGAALDMLAAMSTGHEGSMTTVHANNPKEAVGRLVNLCLMAGEDLPSRAIMEQIASAVNLIIQISRLSDGSRKIISVSEVQGMQGEVVTQQEVFTFKEKGFDKNRRIVGQFHATGLIPKFIEKFERKGIAIPKSLFSNEALAAVPAPGAPPQAPAPPPRSPSPAPSAPVDPLKRASGGNR